MGDFSEETLCFVRALQNPQLTISDPLSNVNAISCRTKHTNKNVEREEISKLIIQESFELVNNSAKKIVHRPMTCSSTHSKKVI